MIAHILFDKTSDFDNRYLRYWTKDDKYNHCACIIEKDYMYEYWRLEQYKMKCTKHLMYLNSWKNKDTIEIKIDNPIKDKRDIKIFKYPSCSIEICNLLGLDICALAPQVLYEKLKLEINWEIL